MKKGGILNMELSAAIASARHGDAIMILDAGMPVPNGCKVIDLSIVRGLPSFLEVVRAVLNDLVAERWQAFDLMPQYNPDMYAALQDMLSRQPGGTISEADMQELMPKAKAVIRTGEFGSCCNMVLYSASGMDKYVEKFDVSFPEVRDR